MPQSDTVLIIGGGVIGVSSAYYLARLGRSVILLDRGEICSGASYGNAGLILPSHSIPLASPGALGAGLRWMLDPESPFYIKPRFDPELLVWLLRFMSNCREGKARKAVPMIRDLQRESLRLYEELVRQHAIDCGFERKGMWMLYHSRRGYEQGLKEAALLAEHGIEHQSLDGEGVHAIEPSVPPCVAGGILYPEDAHVNPSEFVIGLARVAQSLGVQIHTNTEVFGFETSGRKITRVLTTRGDFTPGEIVLAAGSWSPQVAKSLRVKLPIQAAKGYHVTVKRPAVCPNVPILSYDTRVAATPLGDRLRFSGTLELAGLDMTINPRRVEAIIKGARSFLKGLDHLEVMETWRGLRPCTPDGLPVIGRPASSENLIIATGHAMIGQSLGPVTGKLVAEIASHEEPSLDISAMRCERFGRR